MELFYNPERMSETEIKETFVAHQWLVDEIISIIKHQPKSGGIQHVVIVAPRGMGKTTLLLMLRFTLLNQNIAKRWQPILFPEESYSVYDLADLWIEVLDHIATETLDVVLHDEVEKLKNNHPNSSELEAIALANIKDWRDKHKKRLLLLVDNFDLILDQIGNEKDNASLRDVLMNDGTMMLVGGSTTFFKEARAYNQPLYNLFKIYNLNGLDSDQIEELLRRRAKIDGLENFEETLRANRSRLRILEYFTGGNPRLALMLYRVITHSDTSEVRRGLEKLLDEVTPYYKAKIETLPPQQRKILDQIARISAQTREGLTPTEIATATRLAVNQVSSQLKRLADVGYVTAANIKGRSSYYTLSEPLYAIWHQMRFGREARTRMNWLVGFLKVWYDAKELSIECQRLQDSFRNHLSAGREKDARDALEHRRYLMEAIEDQSSRVRTFESIVLGYLELRDVDTLKREVLIDSDIRTLSPEIRQRLVSVGLITKEWLGDAQTKDIDAAFERIRTAYNEARYDEAIEMLKELAGQFPENSVALLLVQAQVEFTLEDYNTCLETLESVLERQPDLAPAWSLMGDVLKLTSRTNDAIAAFERASELQPSIENLQSLAETLAEVQYWKDALRNYERILEIQPNFLPALKGYAPALVAVSRTKEAISILNQILSIQPNNAPIWFTKGMLLNLLGDVENGFKCVNRAIQLNPNDSDYFLFKAWLLGKKKRTEEAFQAINTALQLDSESADAYFVRAGLLVKTNFDAARADYKRAFNLNSDRLRLFVDDYKAKLIKTMLAVIEDEPEQIRASWQELIRSIETESDKTAWLGDVSTMLNLIAQAGYWSLTQELITAAALDEQLYPLARALDYLVKGEEAAIEKLSPEVRRIVDEIINTLKKSKTNTNVMKNSTRDKKSNKKGRKRR